ncbi:divalent-cation tolerance protein CutA [Candidatus Woesearchaeota archaeon]|nr:divalent-cation tolerance protein CutA [Candidatus Woesearchaeota archaeon]|tara:strand:- start:13319 stop:13618 length:300 start_codon:yes stop_codon:yes gene_type:complete
MISVYITCKDLDEAKNIAKHLLDNKLIACANMFPVESMFNWDGKINDVKETAMFCKAKKENFKKIEEEVKKLHSYEVPCIVAFDWVDSNKHFSEWVKNG